MFGKPPNKEILSDVVLATQVHTSKVYHLEFGKVTTRSNLSQANNTRGYRIFEEFAYRVVAEAQHCRATDIFIFSGKVYAFDSTTIDLCLRVFEKVMFRKKKVDVKVRTLYDIETQIPTFFHIVPAKFHDTQASDVIPYEENAFYIFDRAYNDFRPVCWNRRFPPRSIQNPLTNRPQLLVDSKDVFI